MRFGSPRPLFPPNYCANCRSRGARDAPALSPPINPCAPYPGGCAAACSGSGNTPGGSGAAAHAGGDPTQAATITVDGATRTLVDAITAANTDTATNGCTADSGNGLLRGDEDNDTLDGGPNTDLLFGGPGTDTCLNGEQLRTCE